MPQNKIRIVYSKDYAVDIGSHVFPTSKYNRIRERLLSESAFMSVIEFVAPAPASERDILLAHEKTYLEKLKNGTLTREEKFRLEVPYSRELVRSSLICCGGTMLACDIAFKDGAGIHLGGGFHHAFSDHGEGFCILNDVAVAARYAKERRLAKKVAIVDCDLHQGNGTAAIFAGDRDVYTFSIHQESNFPFFKPKSSLDIGLRDRAGDSEYLSALYGAIPKIVSDFKPDLVIYVAGADPYEDDQIGGLALSKNGLRKRDEFIFETAKSYGVPVAVVLAGGYAAKEEDTVDIHYNTIEAGLRIFFGGRKKA